jgi:two-component system, sensor histidine kinase LadS
MKKHLIIYLLFLFISLAKADIINIETNTPYQEILSKSEIYIDPSKKLSINDITQLSQEFQKNTHTRLSYGYSPNFNVWIKFSLKNNTNKPIRKIVEYANPLTTHLEFFDPKNSKSYKDGLFQINQLRKSVNPYFEITLQPNELKTYYLKASSEITTMIIKLKLYNTQSFFNKELEHQSVLQFFFGAMSILALYNFFIWLFTRDISYLFYVLYLIGIILHHLIYIGIGASYLYSQQYLTYIITYASILVTSPALALGLFTKYFLRIKQYPKLNNILTSLLILTTISAIFFLFPNNIGQYRNFLPSLLLIYLMFITFYSFYKKNRQARFIAFAWVLFASSGLFMYLSSVGIIDIFNTFPYFIEFTLIIEAIVFSIALSDKINHLQKERDHINQTLITQQKTEKKRLSLEVQEKTKKLNIALQHQTDLLKELNHRVKNNMQTIISLIRLQTDEIEDENTKDAFVTIQNRIKAMSYLHELLYKQVDVATIPTYEYFDILVDNLLNSYELDVKVKFNIQTDLEVEQAISCGLILNELVINSFKYAFDETIDDPEIFIELYKEGESYYFNIYDNGIGYDNINSKNSFGLVLVSTLVEGHLEGTINIFIENGVRNQIRWEDVI